MKIQSESMRFKRIIGKKGEVETAIIQRILLIVLGLLIVFLLAKYGLKMFRGSSITMCSVASWFC
ncbi:MAG: hypothetical protein V1659_00615 [Candidatus Woesearchaeota archaeon]